jgi:hypothetical protein
VISGNVIPASSEILQAEWSSQVYSFHSNLKVLPLYIFDMILGMEWLERFSPMKIHWAHKWPTIPYQHNQITLQGLLLGSLNYVMIELMHVSTDLDKVSADIILPTIQNLLNQFQVVFATPVE